MLFIQKIDCCFHCSPPSPGKTGYLQMFQKGLWADGVERRLLEHPSFSPTMILKKQLPPLFPLLQRHWEKGRGAILERLKCSTDPTTTTDSEQSGILCEWMCLVMMNLYTFTLHISLHIVMPQPADAMQQDLCTNPNLAEITQDYNGSMATKQLNLLLLHF